MSTQEDLFWTYVHDPLILNNFHLGSPEIMVKSNDTCVLGMPSTGRIAKEEGRFEYIGHDIGLPVCFVKDGISPGCLKVVKCTLSGGEQTVCIRLPNGDTFSSVTQLSSKPQSFLPCEKETRFVENMLY